MLMEYEDNERYCGNCFWYCINEAKGIGWCCNDEQETSFALVCDKHEF